MTTDDTHSIIIYSLRDKDGQVRATRLQQKGESLSLESYGEAALWLPLEAVAAVFARYGKPLEEGFVVGANAENRLSLSNGMVVCSFRFLNFGDVYETDYLCLENPSKETVAAPAPLITAALKALALAYQQKRNKDKEP